MNWVYRLGKNSVFEKPRLSRITKHGCTHTLYIYIITIQTIIVGPTKVAWGENISIQLF